MIKFFSNNKIIFYSSNFFLIFLYLFPGSLLGLAIHNDIRLQPQISPDFIVSSNHLYVFLLVSIIGFFTFNKSKHFFYISFYLIFLSIILEILHFLIPKRSFEFSDLFGNLLAVFIVIIIFYYFKKNENSKT